MIPKDSIQYFGITTENDALRGGTFWFEGSFELRKNLMSILATQFLQIMAIPGMAGKM
ncbi:MAG: hypothetical protein MZV64_39060 [Ignavibacteriales bacterium]|nr:hypothetical protein [Ignavibacteriales bacterium]